MGDFGWEAEDLTKDGSIWLHGLSVQWKMACRAGFKPEEIEYVGPKPVSHYDWKDFEYDGPKATSVHSSAIPKTTLSVPGPKDAHMETAISDMKGVCDIGKTINRPNTQFFRHAPS